MTDGSARVDASVRHYQSPLCKYCLQSYSIDFLFGNNRFHAGICRYLTSGKQSITIICIFLTLLVKVPASYSKADNIGLGPNPSVLDITLFLHLVL